MFKLVYPQKDSFISNHPKLLDRNFGIDEVLEIESRRILDDATTGYVPLNSRGLIQFDITDISSSIASGEISNPRFFLELFTVEAIDTPRKYTVYVNPVSQSWEVGQGRLYDDTTTDGISWIYRNGSNDLWSGSLSASLAEVSLSLSESVSFTSDFLKTQGGGTWHESYISSSFIQSTASITITSIEDGDSFILTSPSGSSYTFRSETTIVSESTGQASASVDIGFMETFDRFTISASKQANITVIPDNNLNGCDDEYYIGWASSSTSPTESKAVIQFTAPDIASEKEFMLNDCWNDVSWSFRATTNPYIVDPKGCNIKFFVVDGSVSQSVSNLADEINSIDNLFLTASVSESISVPENDVFLILDSVDMGNSGNCFYFWDTDNLIESSSRVFCGGKFQETLITNIEDRVYLDGGVGVGKKPRFDHFIARLSELTSSYGFGFDVEDYSVMFTADISGSVGNEYYFSSGSNHTQSFSGGTTSSYLSQPDDIPDTNTYFFETASTDSGSVENLSNKINSVVDFVETNASASTLQLTSSVAGVSGISFTSGSTTVTLPILQTSSSQTLQSTQSFNFETSDINVDVTDIVNSWLTDEIPNEGFIIRNSGEGESVDYGKLRFYSLNTNTIYIPRLTVKWDDQLFDTSLDTIDIENDNVVYVKNLKESYKYNEIVKLNLLARERYPQKTFSNAGSRFITTKALPENTTFAVQDAESEEYLIPFDDYNKISCDDSGPFFILDMNSLPQERYFRLLFKSSKNGVTLIFKEKGIFKVTR